MTKPQVKLYSYHVKKSFVHTAYGHVKRKWQGSIRLSVCKPDDHERLSQYNHLIVLGFKFYS